MEVVIIANEETYKKIPSELRLEFIRVEFKEENEYQSNKEDPLYLKMYKEKKRVSDLIKEHLFRKRHR